jgi:hypothetical protein
MLEELGAQSASTKGLVQKSIKAAVETQEMICTY